MSRMEMSINIGMLDKLSSQYGESFYLLDSQKFASNYDEFLNKFRKIYPKTDIGYSYKTNYIPKLCSIIKRKNGYAEVVSEMEYVLAEKIGMDPKRIIVNGPYKSKDALKRMLLNGSVVNLDSYYEIDLVEEIALGNNDLILNVGIRCNFELDEFKNSRFGFDVNSPEFIEGFRKLQYNANVRIVGIHCHFPNRNIESYVSRVSKITQVAERLFSHPPEFISIGGGYFGKMDKSLEKQFNYKVPKYHEYAQVIATQFNQVYKNVRDEAKPRLVLEPGTAIAADTMKFVVKIIDIKNIRGKHFATTSGSKFNIGAFASTLNLPVEVYSVKSHTRENYYNDIDIAGYTCIESDFLYKSYNGYLNVGDYIVINNVGSYSFNFKPPFILPNVAIVDYDNISCNHSLVKRNENFDDVFRTFFDDNTSN